MYKEVFFAEGDNGEIYTASSFMRLIQLIEDDHGETVGDKTFYKATVVKEIELTYKEGK